MPLIHAEVTDEAVEYLEEWAEAVGCERHHVAGDAIDNYLRDNDKI